METATLAPQSRTWIRDHYSDVESVIARALSRSKQESSGAGEPSSLHNLTSVIEELCAVLERHVRFEIEQMIPRLEPLEHLGPDRVQRVLDRHERVRMVVDVLQTEPPVGASIERCVRQLESEIDESVMELVIPDVINDDAVVADELSS